MKFKGYLSGWSTVFSFTLRNQLCKKSYIALTATIAVLIFAAVTGLIIIPGQPNRRADSHRKPRWIW